MITALENLPESLGIEEMRERGERLKISEVNSTYFQLVDKENNQAGIYQPEYKKGKIIFYSRRKVIQLENNL